MSQKIDNFCDDLCTTLNAADKRLRDLKASATHSEQKGQG